MVAGVPSREMVALGFRQCAEWGLASLRHSERVQGAEHTDFTPAGINGAAWKHFRPAVASSCPIPVPFGMSLPNFCPDACCHELSVRGKEHPALTQ